MSASPSCPWSRDLICPWVSFHSKCGHRPVELASSERLLELQTLRPQPRPVESEQHCTKSPGDSCAQLSLRSAGLCDHGQLSDPSTSSGPRFDSMFRTCARVCTHTGIFDCLCTMAPPTWKPFILVKTWSQILMKDLEQ